MEHPVIQNILTRRSVRRYKAEQISPEERNLLLRAAVWAPSGRNRQSWLFTAIQAPAVLRELNETVKGALLADPPDPAEYSAVTFSRKRAAAPDFHFFFHAPTLIVASNDAANPNGMADCAAALENVFLAAHALGLGSCWVNLLHWMDKNETVRAFLAGLGIPREHTVCGSAAVGFPEGDAPKALARRPGTVRIIGEAEGQDG